MSKIQDKSHCFIVQSVMPAAYAVNLRIVAMP